MSPLPFQWRWRRWRVGGGRAAGSAVSARMATGLQLAAEEAVAISGGVGRTGLQLPPALSAAAAAVGFR